MLYLFPRAFFCPVLSQFFLSQVFPSIFLNSIAVVMSLTVYSMSSPPAAHLVTHHFFPLVPFSGHSYLESLRFILFDTATPLAHLGRKNLDQLPSESLGLEVVAP